MKLSAVNKSLQTDKLKLSCLLPCATKQFVDKEVENCKLHLR